MEFDVCIRGGTVIDGTGRSRYQSDVAINGDRIAAVGDLSAASGRSELDATGLIVAPGFLDVHTHSDSYLWQEPLRAKIAQGFTTEFVLLDGIGYAPVNEQTAAHWIQYLRPLDGLRFPEYTGWQSLAEFLALYEGRTSQNVVAHVPYANVRTLAMGFGPGTPDDFQMLSIQRQIQAGMAAGAVGLSTGLDYVDECWASTDELARACLALEGGVYVTHVRYNWGTLAGVQEAVEIGKRAGCPVHISHLKATNTPETEELIDYIDNVAVNEVEFSFDVYPYVPSSTMLQYLLPYEVFRDGVLAAPGRLLQPEVRARFAREIPYLRLDDIYIGWLPSRANAHFMGQSLGDYVRAVGGEPVDALSQLLIAESFAVLLVFRLGDDRFVEPWLAHDRFMMGSDGIYFPDGHIHPRHYGSGARLLGQYARDKGLMTLEAAVHKMTGFPAERFGLADRGRLATDMAADIVIFDAGTVNDRATFAEPKLEAVGVRDVFVNGIRVWADGDLATPAGPPGRVLKPSF
ncbi:MAG: D-aminoacylase [Anaerolineales bacterium]|nr:D-aminoacylase [Anaerolineales bacterium]